MTADEVQQWRLSQEYKDPTLRRLMSEAKSPKTPQSENGATRALDLMPYPKYKPSGVEWLGDVPEHWEVIPVKRCCRIVNGATPSSTEPTYWHGSVRWITPEDLGQMRGRKMYKTRRTLTRLGLASCGTQLVPISTVVLSTRAPIGYVAITAVPSCTNQGCRSLLPIRSVLEPVFLYYMVLSQRAVLQGLGRGTTFAELSADEIGYFLLPLPPSVSDQRAIARYLDRETAKIDALIRQKEILVERLDEHRTVLVSRTVTRGLPPDEARKAGFDPHPKLKPSGVEWLGDVPEHWEVRRLKYLVSINDDVLPESTDSDYTIQYVDIGNVDHRRGVHSLESTTFGAAPSRARRVVRHGDTIVSTVRTYLRAIASIRNPASNMIVSTGFAVLRPRSALFFSGFAYHILNAFGFVEEVVARSVGANYPAISANQIGSIPVATPPLLEQRATARYLDRETAKIDRVAELARREVELLREYRTRLISDVVTGKVDVRGIAGTNVEAAA